MRYKTRKYIKKAVFYLITGFLITLVYVVAAQKYYLPALFEYYTGKKVRTYSAKYYEKYFGTVTAEGSSGETNSFHYLNILDYIVREPNYLYISDLIRTISQNSGELSNRTRNDIFSIATNPALAEWLSDPHGQFASVYQYEVIRYIESFDSIQGYGVIDLNKKVLYNKDIPGVIPDSFTNTNELLFQDGKISMPVRFQGKTIGRFFAITENLFNQNLSFENSGYGMSSIITDSKGHIIKSTIQDPRIDSWIRDNLYHGPVSGVYDNFRIVSDNLPNFHLIIIYKRESAAYYVFKLLLYMICISLIVWLVYYLKKVDLLSIFKRRDLPDLDHLLARSNEVNREYALMNLKFQNSMQTIKSQEMDRLRVISEHLTYLHQSVRVLDDEIQ